MSAANEPKATLVVGVDVGGEGYCADGTMLLIVAIAMGQVG